MVGAEVSALPLTAIMRDYDSNRCHESEALVCLVTYFTLWFPSTMTNKEQIIESNYDDYQLPMIIINDNIDPNKAWYDPSIY